MTQRTNTMRSLSLTFAVSLLLFMAAPIFAAQAPTSPPALTVSPDTSLNWAGYAATGGIFTGVSGSWTVPEVSVDAGNAELSADTAWVGIGGVLGSDLIQAGTQAIVAGSGRVAYQAWYETLPQNSEPLPVAISPGDQVSVSLDRGKNNQWTIDFTNRTTGKNFSMSVQYSSSLSSAEWMVETPSTNYGILPLDNFGYVPFTSGTATMNGKTETIQSSGAQPVQLTNLFGETLASPSDLNPDGASFTVMRTKIESVLTSPLRPHRFGYSTAFPDYYYRYERDQGLSFDRPWWDFGF